MCSGTQAGGVRASGPDKVQGKCTCGWRGPERVYVKRAMQDLLNHMTESPRSEALTTQRQPAKGSNKTTNSKFPLDS